MKRKQVKAPKQRNPIVDIVMFRSGAGVHDKPNKAKRAADKVATKKQVRDSFDPDRSFAA